VSGAAPGTLAEIPAGLIRWVPAGQVVRDHAGDLKFPPVRPVPGIYRFTVEDQSRVVAEYVGQAVTSVARRFALYRSRGRKPSLPLDRKTTSRNARYLLDALAEGYSVSVALPDDRLTRPGGQVLAIDLADKEVRDELEKELIEWLCATGVKVLNRRFTPYEVNEDKVTGPRQPGPP
jgi:hypothetical protein